MKIIYRYSIFFLTYFLLSSCNKQVHVSSLSSIKDTNLETKDSLYNARLVEVDQNYFGIHPSDISHIAANYLDSVDLSSYVPDHVIKKQVAQEIKAFYENNNYSLAWSDGRNSNQHYKYLISQLALSEQEGLNPADYHIDRLTRAKKETFKDKKYINIFQLLDHDIKTTATLLTYAWHIENGRVDPGKKNWRWAFDMPATPVGVKLSAALKDNSFKDGMENLTPTHPQYKQLKEALESLQAAKRKEEWPIVPDNVVIEPGDTNKYVPIIRERLIASGDLRRFWKKKRTSKIYDETLLEAVKDFQRVHGLEEDGVVGKSTRKMLNMTIDEKISIVKLNLERLRWLPEQMSSDHLLINIPGFRVAVVNDGKEIWDMKIIVGESFDHATPIFHDSLEYIVFSPTWGVPNSIVQKEIIPLAKKDPGYLSRNNYQVYNAKNNPIDPGSIDFADTENIRIVQQPGPHNALGLVKFIMPNRYNIYLHDTPTDYLFNRNERDFSHGCIRLEEPAKLAKYLLSNNNSEIWDDEKIAEHMNEEYSTTIWLDKTMPVYMTYQTAFVDEDGSLNFREDVYGYDEEQYEQIVLEDEF